jgi:putative transposase
MPRRKEPRIPDTVLDQLLAGADPKTAFDPNGLIDDLKKALAERVLNAEMEHHLAGEEPGNRRNGYGNSLCGKAGFAALVDSTWGAAVLES